MPWLRMRWRLVMLLGVRRSRRTRLTLVLLLLACLLAMRLGAPRLLGRVLRRRLVMRLRRLVLVMGRCLRRIPLRAVPRLLLRMLAGRSRRRLAWIRWCPTPLACWRLRLRMMWRRRRPLGLVRRRRGISPWGPLPRLRRRRTLRLRVPHWRMVAPRTLRARWRRLPPTPRTLRTPPDALRCRSRTRREVPRRRRATLTVQRRRRGRRHRSRQRRKSPSWSGMLPSSWTRFMSWRRRSRTVATLSPLSRTRWLIG